MIRHLVDMLETSQGASKDQVGLVHILSWDGVEFEALNSGAQTFSSCRRVAQKLVDQQDEEKRPTLLFNWVTLVSIVNSIKQVITAVIAKEKVRPMEIL